MLLQQPGQPSRLNKSRRNAAGRIHRQCVCFVKTGPCIGFWVILQSKTRSPKHASRAFKVGVDGGGVRQMHAPCVNLCLSVLSRSSHKDSGLKSRLLGLAFQGLGNLLPIIGVKSDLWLRTFRLGLRSLVSQTSDITKTDPTAKTYLQHKGYHHWAVA
jgi:hypothetical protein